MRRLVWLVLTAGLCGCADVQRYFSGERTAGLGESDYLAVPLSRLADTGLKQVGRFKTEALFVSIEDTVLDLPDDYHKGWLRFRVAEPAAPASEWSNLVVPEGHAKILTELKKGEPMELFVQRVMTEDSWAFNDSAPKGILLRVESARRPAPKPAIAAAASAGRPIVFLNKRRSDEFIRFLQTGKFQLRDRGRDLEGGYDRSGDHVTFRLPNGKTAKARLQGDTLTDPDGKEWYRSKE